MGIIINEKHSKWPQKICSPSCIKTNPTMKSHQKDKLNMSKELMTNKREKLMVIHLAKLIPKVTNLDQSKRIAMVDLEKDNMTDTLELDKTLSTSMRRKEVPEKETGVQKTLKLPHKVSNQPKLKPTTNQKNQSSQY